MTDNPLSKYFRKPTYYMSIPTRGVFNPEIPQTILDEIPILPMTAIDEISMKNPDELLNGEALINLIKSCVPSIPNPRKLCNVDVEALYMGIQHATYGNEMTHNHKCSECGEISEFSIDISYIINRFPELSAVEPVEYNELKIHVKPPTVESVTRLALIELEQKRLIRFLQEQQETIEEADETELAKNFYKGFRKIAEHNVDLLANTIGHIETPEGDIDDYNAICEFLENIPTDTVNEINERVQGLISKPEDMNKFEFTCPECDTKDEVVMEVNPVNFSETG